MSEMNDYLKMRFTNVMAQVQLNSLPWILYPRHTRLFGCWEFMGSLSWLHSPQAPRLENEGSNGRGLWMHRHRSISAVCLFFSWRFTCTNLWKTCVHHSTHLQGPLANSPVLVHRIDLFPLALEMGVFYVDEVIIADTNLTGDH